MASTDIEYLDYTWNIAPGCTMVSPGCTNCWAQMMAKRLKAMGQENYKGLTDDRGRWTGEVNMLINKLSDPLRLKKPRRIGVNYMGDLFHPKVETIFIIAAFEAMLRANWHTYYVLTKRPERAVEILRNSRLYHHRKELQHVFIGTTVENMDMARKRVIAMMDIHETGFRTWVSYEPALSQVYWGPWNFIEFMVAGGESGPKARPMHPDWARTARDWCLKHEIKFFFKQWGAWAPLMSIALPEGIKFSTRPVRMGKDVMCKVGKHKGGRRLDGYYWEDMP